MINNSSDGSHLCLVLGFNGVKYFTIRDNGSSSFLMTNFYQVNKLALFFWLTVFSCLFFGFCFYQGQNLNVVK